MQPDRECRAKWVVYEREKRRIYELNLPKKQYDDLIIELLEKLKIR